MRDRLTERIDRCPHCVSDWGVYLKFDLLNIHKNMDFNGKSQYNGEMYDNAEKIIDKPTVYCQVCDKPICSVYTFCRKNGIIPFGKE